MLRTNTELTQRVITGAVLGGLMLVLLLFSISNPVGVVVLLLVLSLCSLRAAWEVYELRKSLDSSLAILLPVLGVFFELSRIGLNSNIKYLVGVAFSLWLIVSFALLFIKLISVKPSINEFAEDLAPSIILQFSVSLPLALLAALIASPNAIPYLLWTIIVVSATDIAAYFGGKNFSGPKLAPIVSPNKTWSGLLSGLLAAALLGSLWAYFFLKPLGNSFFILSLLIAFIAQTSDLMKSYIKRVAKVKDTGQLLPGHGGLLDRIDGHLGASAFVTACCLMYL